MSTENLVENVGVGILWDIRGAGNLQIGATNSNSVTARDDAGKASKRFAKRGRACELRGYGPSQLECG